MEDNENQEQQNTPLVPNTEEEALPQQEIEEKQTSQESINQGQEENKESNEAEKPKINEEDIEERYEISENLRKTIFIVFILISAITQSDGGIVPAAHDEIQEDMGASQSEFGLYGSIDYFGRIFGSIGFVAIINIFNRKYLLLVTLVCKALCLFVSIFTKKIGPNLAARCIMGIFQVFFTIYLPVWCDQVGKVKKRTLMITLIQVGTPLGVVVGFGCQTIVKNWVVSYILEGAVLIGLGIFLFFMPNYYFSVNLQLNPDNELELISLKKKVNENGEPIEDDENKNLSLKQKIGGFCSRLGKILCEPVFLFTGLANSVGFFGMAVIQFWANNYLQDVIGMEDEFQRFAIFAMVCITSPPIGMLVGGFVGSKVGGYMNKRAILVCLISLIISSIFATVCRPINNAWLYAVDMWFYLFFSCGVIPLETGIVINSLDSNLRGDGFSVMNFLLNLTGNLPAAYAYGVIDDHASNKKTAMMVCMLYTWFAVITLTLGSIFRYRKKDEDVPTNEVNQVADNSNSQEEKNDTDKIKSEIKNNYSEDQKDENNHLYNQSE